MANARAAFTLREATAADASPLLKLQESIYHEGSSFVGDGPSSLETLSRRLRALNSEASLYLVAERRGGVLGGWLELNRHAPSRLRHVAVLTLAVAEPFRRRGLARALLHAAYDWAEEVGVEKISLHVRANNRAAIRLYESEGFLLEGCERAHIRTETGYEDNWLMAKFLRLGRG